MSRLPAVIRDELPEKDQIIYDHIGAERKEVANVFKTLMNSPGAALVVADVGAYVRYHTKLLPAIRELVILTVARWFNSQYEWSQHEHLAYQAGVNPKTIERIKRGDFRIRGKTEEAITLKFTLELIRKCTISDDTFKVAIDKYGKKGIVDLVVLIGYYTMLAHCISALQPDIDPGLKTDLPIIAPTNCLK